MSRARRAMTKASIGYQDITGIKRRGSGIRRLTKVFLSRGLVAFGIAVIILFIISAIFAPFLAPYDPYKQDLDSPLLQPCKAHILGTDILGRDTLSRLIYGSRTAIIVGVLVVGIATVVGVSLGAIAGYFGKLTFLIIMRTMDALMSIPMILLALVIGSLLGGGLKNVIIALGIALIPGYARMMCGQTLSIKENDYVTASRSLGASNLRIVLRHIIPNGFAPLIVMMTMQLGSTILAEAGLSFLGLGIKPPGAAWGAMVSDGYQYLLRNPMLSFAPGIAVMLVVFSFNMVGDGLRDALDPRLRGLL
jgi:peptide/nickel transport system permease protein